MLDWHDTVVNISPPVEQRVYGAYVMVEIQHTLQMPRIVIPVGWNDTVFELGGPFQISAVSRRSLD
jgi:hypothetical protein